MYGNDGMEMKSLNISMLMYLEYLQVTMLVFMICLGLFNLHSSELFYSMDLCVDIVCKNVK